MTREELKPCPFCGGKAERKFIGNDFTKKRSVEIICTGCHTRMIVGAIRNNHDWCDEVITKKWNNRQADLPPAEGADPKKVQWSGYSPLGNISQRPAQPQPIKTCWGCGAEIHYLPNGLSPYRCECGAVNPEETMPQPTAKSAEAEEATIEEEKILLLFAKHTNCFGKSPIKLPCMTRSAFVAAIKEFAAIQNKSQPTAEGAEKILTKEQFTDIVKRTCENVWHSRRSLDPIKEQTELIVEKLYPFFTLYTQRIADKMVSERLREELIGYINWFCKFDYENKTDMELVDEYLKSRDSHE